jgi:hypothetical protein
MSIRNGASGAVPFSASGHHEDGSGMNDDPRTRLRREPAPAAPRAARRRPHRRCRRTGRTPARPACGAASGFVAGYWAGDGEIALHRWQLCLPCALTYCLPVLAEGGHCASRRGNPAKR